MANRSPDVFVPKGADLNSLRKNPASLGKRPFGLRPIEYGGDATPEEIKHARRYSNEVRPISHGNLSPSPESLKRRLQRREASRIDRTEHLKQHQG